MSDTASAAPPGSPASAPTADPFVLRRFAVGLAILLLASFPDVLIGWRSFYTRDFSNFGYPLAYHVQQSFRAGEVPLWNPYNFAGLPFLAQWNTLAVYPLSLIYILLPLPWSLNLFNLLHLYLGGVGMFCLARRWLNDGRAASVAGVGYAFGGVMISSLMWPNNIAALGWLPAVLLAGERAATEGGRHCVHAALVVAFQFLAGAPEIIVLTWAGLAVLVSASPEGKTAFMSARLRRLVLVLLAAGGLDAIQFLPFVEFLSHSQRGVEFAGGEWTLTWGGLGNFIVPLFRTYKDRDDIYFQGAQQWVTSYYAGITILLAAGLGLWFRRDRRTLLLGCAGALSILLALGPNGPIYDGLRKVLPVLGVMRYPIKFIVPVAVILPLLAAIGVHAWLQDRSRSRPLSVTAVVLGLVSLILIGFSSWHPARGEVPSATLRSGLSSVICLLALWWLLSAAKRAPWSRQGGLLFTALVFVVYIDLLLANRGANPVVHPDLLIGKVAEITPRPTLGNGRVLVSDAGRKKLDGTIFTSPEAAVQIPRRALVLNNNLLEQVPKLDGFFSLYLRSPAALAWRLSTEKDTNSVGLLDFLSVSSVSNPQRPWEWNARTNWLPMVTLVPRVSFLDRTNTFQKLFSPEYNPREEAFLLPDVAGRTHVSGAGRGRVADLRVSAHSIDATTETDAPMLLTVAQANYPGWRARVDNAPVPVWTANGAFQAVEVPAGRHQVRIVFRSTSFEGGVILSVLGLVACAVLRFKVAEKRWNRDRSSAGPLAFCVRPSAACRPGSEENSRSEVALA